MLRVFSTLSRRAAPGLRSAQRARFARSGVCRHFSGAVKDAEVKEAEYEEIVPPGAADAAAEKPVDPNVTNADVKGVKVEKQDVLDDVKEEEEDVDLEKMGIVKPDTAVDETKAKVTVTESVSGASAKHSFQAETRKILDIVANSIYTDKEVFLREIISNASDALEKARYMQHNNQSLYQDDLPLEVRIFTDDDANTITIQDFGVGMKETELINNLGTIARSGSKEFVQQMEGGDPGEIIGQFGVGFYSTFMVGDKVEVFSRTAEDGEGEQSHVWTSDGSGDFEIAKATGVQRGTKIKVFLKKTCEQFASDHVIAGIIKKYSNFVGFPIFLNGKKLNTVKAIWNVPKNEVTQEQHTEFYRFVSNSYDHPTYRMHFQTDAPLHINALFYFPERHMEKFGMGRVDPGVNLYSRKVLIQAKCSSILPEWLRFVKGVVDSEDLPLNISRESMQDSVLISRLNNVLTKRVIKFIAAEAKMNPEGYMTWFREFGNYIKEGVCGDFQNKADIAKLLRFETSVEDKGKEVSLDDYISRMPVHQDKIYYLSAPSREFANNSPYLESFKKDGIEVLFLYQHIDEFCMKNLDMYQKRKLISVESSDATTARTDGKDGKDKDGKDITDGKESKESKAAAETKKNEELCAFMKGALGDVVQAVKTSSRLVSSPAMIVDHESASVRRMLKMVDQSQYQQPVAKQKLEINPEHSVIKKLFALRVTKPDVAKLAVEQVYDNALIAADIMENPRAMLPRLNKLLDAALEK